MQNFGVWKSSWLPYTETFIRDQIVNVPGWHPIRLGFTNIQKGIDRALYAPYRPTFVGNLSRSVLSVHPYIRNYTQRLREADAQVLHAHFGPGGIEALPISRAAGLPLVTTFHGADATGSHSRYPWVRGRYPRMLQQLLQEGSKQVAVSTYIADMLIARGASPESIEVIYTGTRPTPLERRKDRGGIVFVGRLIDIKGPMHLLRAVNAMPEKLRYGTRVTMVGEGPLRGELEAFAQERRLNVQFTGRLASHEIPGVLRSHTVFCGPSLPSQRGTREGFGMVFLEASLQQLPCVGYMSGGVQEAVLHNVTGLLAPEGNVVTLSKYLAELITDTAQAEALGAAGRTRVLRDFGLSGQSALLADLYRSVI